MPSEPQARTRKLPARYIGLVQPLVLSIFMSLVVSGVATIKNIGLAPDFFPAWMSAWGVSWLIAFPTLLLVLPLVKRIVALVVDVPKGLG